MHPLAVCDQNRGRATRAVISKLETPLVAPAVPALWRIRRRRHLVFGDDNQ
jgi:hypothetical protein